MKQTGLFLILLLHAALLNGQNSDVLRPPDAFFPGEKAKVLVVGTFHLDYPNRDAVKIESEEQIDVLTEPKKSEITELVQYIKRFKPNKIAIEAFPEWNATQKLNAYKKGCCRNERDERFQLAMRIAADFDMDTLYSIDAGSIAEDLYMKDSVFVENLYTDYDYQSNDEVFQQAKDFYNYSKALPRNTKLLDYYQYLNSRTYHYADYGSYLTGDFKLDNHRGADVLSIGWYSRNLRIFRNLQQITDSPEDRILIIFGNGHASVLRQLLEISPEYEFIEFGSLK